MRKGAVAGMGIAALLCAGAAAAGLARAAEGQAPAYPADAVQPVNAPIAIVVRPGWRAQCRSETEAGPGRPPPPAIAIEKRTFADNGTAMTATIRIDRGAGGGAASAYRERLRFDAGGRVLQVEIEEVAGHPLSDEAYFALRERAGIHLAETEFSGLRSDEIGATRRSAGSGGSPNASLELDTVRTVAGIVERAGARHLLVTRTGVLSGGLEGQDVTIRFSGYVLIHIESGLVAEDVLATELRAESGAWRETAALSCNVEPIVGGDPHPNPPHKGEGTSMCAFEAKRPTPHPMSLPLVGRDRVGVVPHGLDRRATSSRR